MQDFFWLTNSTCFFHFFEKRASPLQLRSIEHTVEASCCVSHQSKRALFLFVTPEQEAPLPLCHTTARGLFLWCDTQQEESLENKFINIVTKINLLICVWGYFCKGFLAFENKVEIRFLPWKPGPGGACSRFVAGRALAGARCRLIQRPAG